MDDALKEALRLRELGFAVHWLVAGQKRPIASEWASAPVMNTDDLRRTYKPGYNVGFRAGKWSVVDGKEICVLDVDVRGGALYAEEAYATARSIMLGKFAPNVLSGSGIGRHQYLGFKRGTAPERASTVLRQSDIWVSDCGRVTSTRQKNARPAWMIELLSTGKNVVLPPSIHPDTGKRYSWME